MNCFECEIVKSSKSCLKRTTQNKNYSTKITQKKDYLRTSLVICYLIIPVFFFKKPPWVFKRIAVV